MRVPLIVGGSLLAIAGAIWTLQGLGSSFVPVSFMTNAREWVVIGLLTMAIGIALAIRGAKRR
ncbi:MAG: hypothetical protein ACC654_04685 [Acidimicrobiia bacterium]